MPQRRTLPSRIAYLVAAGVIGLGLFASVTPSPLYRIYAERWSFSSLTLTLVYAVYAFGVLATLLLAGRVSDEVGRRPVLLVSLAALGLADVLFMLAGSVAWLFVARALQGLATGAVLSAASAALLDLHPRRDPAAVSLANGVASAVGLGLGMLASAALVQLGVEPRVLPYALLLGLIGLALAGCSRLPEAGPGGGGRFRLTAKRPGVPAAARGPFLLASLAVLCSWSIGGLFFSIGPGLAAQLFHSGDAVVASVGVVALAGSAALSQLLLGRTAPWIGAGTGALALAGGMVVLVVAAALGSGGAYLAGSIVGGLGFGVAFLGGLRALVAAIPDAERAAVMSAFYLVAYAALSVPAVVAGLAAGRLGLARTFEIFGVAVAGVALLVAEEAWRTRPRRASAPAREPEPIQL